MKETEDRIHIEKRLSRTEQSIFLLSEDIKDIKKTLRWIIGLIFTLHGSLLTAIIKGVGII